MGNKRALLVRGPSSDQGTFGALFSEGRKICGLLELPWHDNTQQLSCIPTGRYLCVWAKSPRFGWCYHVTGVPDRGHILIHPGNFAGDTTLGFKTHSHGCLLPCTYSGKLTGQKAGLASSPAARRMADHFNKQSFTLEARNA